MVSFWLHAVNDEAQGQVVLSEMYTSFQEGQEMILREDFLDLFKKLNFLIFGLAAMLAEYWRVYQK